MKQLKLLLAILILPACSFAQGTFLFQWHGNSNYFQASFIVTAAEMQPGATFSSLEFTNSVSVDSLSGFAYNAKNDESLFGGGVNPWLFRMTFVDFDRGVELFVRSLSFPVGQMAGEIEEKPISGSDLYFESGFWTYIAIPEPSVAALLIAGICLLLLKGRAAD
jgi:hypothetical protein